MWLFLTAFYYQHDSGGHEDISGENNANFISYKFRKFCLMTCA